ncbi:MAG: HlyD family secretion protein [Gammaproteobacteria bacterium]|nr:HlyD family secretion protein [Gammaproteobacteria bacterium]
MSLFRTEVINKKQDENIFGEVVLIRPISFTIYTVLFVIFVISLGLFLYFGHYASKETVNGVLNPQSGLAKVYAPRRGIVASILVKEGDEVTKGDVIYVVSTERYLGDGGNIQSFFTKENDNTIALIESQIKEQNSLSKIKKIDLDNQLKYLKKEILSIKSEVVFHKQRVSLNAKEASRLKKMSRDQFIPESEYVESHQAHLSSQIELEKLQRNLISKNNQKWQLTIELKKIPVELSQNLLEYKKSLSELRQRYIEHRSNQNYSIIAPASGRITSLTYQEGDTIKPETPLLTILPHHILLKAHLYVPTKAAGFLHIGQEVKIRFDAFPYQKFGIHKGVIEQISKNIIIPGELSLSVDIEEPVYKITVKLNKQSVMAFGREHFLQVGMLLQGDIVRDRNRIIDWVLEPLYSLRGRG